MLRRTNNATTSLKTPPGVGISEWLDALGILLERQNEIKRQIAHIRREIEKCRLAKQGKHEDRNKAITAEVLAGGKMTAVAKKYKLSPVTVRTITHQYCKKKNRPLYESGERSYQHDTWTQTFEPTTDWLCANRRGFGV